ncbi:unnamed protein product [Choristocarpus tenellus]
MPPRRTEATSTFPGNPPAHGARYQTVKNPPSKLRITCTTPAGGEAGEEAVSGINRVSSDQGAGSTVTLGSKPLRKRHKLYQMPVRRVKLEQTPVSASNLSSTPGVSRALTSSASTLTTLVAVPVVDSFCATPKIEDEKGTNLQEPSYSKPLNWTGRSSFPHRNHGGTTAITSGIGRASTLVESMDLDRANKSDRNTMDAGNGMHSEDACLAAAQGGPSGPYAAVEHATHSTSTVPEMSSVCEPIIEHEEGEAPIGGNQQEQPEIKNELIGEHKRACNTTVEGTEFIGAPDPLPTQPIFIRIPLSVAESHGLDEDGVAATAAAAATAAIAAATTTCTLLGQCRPKAEYQSMELGNEPNLLSTTQVENSSPSSPSFSSSSLSSTSSLMGSKAGGTGEGKRKRKCSVRNWRTCYDDDNYDNGSNLPFGEERKDENSTVSSSSMMWAGGDEADSEEEEREECLGEASKVHGSSKVSWSCSWARVGCSRVKAGKKRCEMPQCQLAASFGVEGAQAKFCGSHKVPGMVNVTHRRCDNPGCPRQPSYGMDGDRRASYCQAHKRFGMVNICSPRCQSKGCTIRPSFGRFTDRRASYCHTHKQAGMANIRNRRCGSKGCVLRPTFGRTTAAGASFCVHHKSRLDGMVDLAAIPIDEIDAGAAVVTTTPDEMVGRLGTGSVAV